ncbi:MAG: M23 family metallopeptidase [Chitinophagaceae bacterium]|nr:M23 family metallopeptidase [Chitinophagaceae bacterium]
MPDLFPKRFKLILFLTVVFFYSCKTSGPGIFGKKSPHEQYADRLKNAGLNTSVLGSSWFRVADQSISSPLAITIPYKESGYFSADRPAAAGWRFTALRGQKLTIIVDRKPLTNFSLYIDLWTVAASNQPKHIAAADTSNYSIQHEVEENAVYILRLQPELLSSGEYTISITAGPSLAYPIKAPGKNHIKSFWGAERDGGTRNHEGIDLFAPFRTPVVAAANGRVTRVNENTLGGKVVWLRPQDKNYTLYYAHLDSQLVTDGDNVQVGDTLGLMGNTGNARSTSPHLHFGIYSVGGAVDPLPFVNPVENRPDNISAPLELIGKFARNNNSGAMLYDEPKVNSTPGIPIPANTLLQIEAATSSWFKVSLPDGRLGFIKNSIINEAGKPFRTFTLKTSLNLLDKPDSLGAKKTIIPAGENVGILGNFNNYYFIETRQDVTGWITK